MGLRKALGLEEMNLTVNVKASWDLQQVPRPGLQAPPSSQEGKRLNVSF